MFIVENEEVECVRVFQLLYCECSCRVVFYLLIISYYVK